MYAPRIPESIGGDADSAYPAPVHRWSETQTGWSATGINAQDRPCRWREHRMPPASLMLAAASGSPPDADHKTAALHYVHPETTCPARFVVFARGQPDTHPPAPAPHPVAPIPFSKRRRDGSLTPFSLSCCIVLNPDPEHRVIATNLPPAS